MFEMTTDEIIAFLLILSCTIFYGYINYLRIVIELKIDKKNITLINLLFFRRIAFIHSKYSFDSEYPDKNILALSKGYDKLVPWYYISFGLIAALVLVMIAVRG